MNVTEALILQVPVGRCYHDVAAQCAVSQCGGRDSEY